MRVRFRSLLVLVAGVLAAPPAFATAVDQAKRIHDRLTGVPPTEAELAQMVSDINNGNAKGAAMLAMQNDYFYTVMLPNWFSTWTNVNGDNHVPLNDYSATAIGMIRDDMGFDQVLYGDVLYTGSDALVAAGTVKAFATNSNQHYIDLQTKLINPNTLGAGTTRISLKTFLVKKTQSTLTGISDTAGVLTSEAAGAAYFSAGTNRREARFAFKNFLCMDMPQLSDTSRPDFRVRRDVDRSPGGNSQTFKQTCVGCHGGMDALAGAFAYFDFVNNQLTYTPGTVTTKYNKNNTVFPAGYITTDDSWLNLWIAGANANLGWAGSASGNGARALGKMLSQSTQFSTCMATRVFEMVCLRAPTSEETDTINRLASDFAANGRYSMQNLFAEAAVLPQCMGN
jgi:hypothetical protein